jgi:hypothetical protein
MRRIKNDIKDKVYSSEIIRGMEKSYEKEKICFQTLNSELEEVVPEIDHLLQQVEMFMQWVNENNLQDTINQAFDDQLIANYLREKHLPPENLLKLKGTLASGGIPPGAHDG